MEVLITNEFVHGTLINLLAKGLPRYTVILAKYLAAVIIWSAGLCLAAVVNYGYTRYLFAETELKQLFFSLFCLWLFGCFLLGLILLSSVIAAGAFGGLIISVLGIVGMLVINIIPDIERVNPITLVSDNLASLTGEQTEEHLLITACITLCLLIFTILGSIELFQRKKL